MSFTQATSERWCPSFFQIVKIAGGKRFLLQKKGFWVQQVCLAKALQQSGLNSFYYCVNTC